ncbi:MAG: helix-turn-helix transcriptional regulator [Candidatus Ancaeobacter aquaticus]|nr:helix-turn-helix transcriptional regulator [Candidatus Ancaeobacter aquaticus]
MKAGLIALNIGNRIRYLRIAKHMTIGELAKKVMVSPSLISQVEKGKCQCSVFTLSKIVDAFGEKLSNFLINIENSKL